MSLGHAIGMWALGIVLFILALCIRADWKDSRPEYDEDYGND